MKKIIVIGGGGHAKVIISILKRINDFSIAGYTDKTDNKSILGAEHLGDDSILAEYYNNGVTNCVLGIGQLRSPKLRQELTEKLENIGFDFPIIVAPSAIINEDVNIGEGSVIMDGVVINCGTKIGKFGIINTNASVDHDCIIGNFDHIAPGVTLSGEVIIGDNVLIGTGSSVIQGKKIVSNCVIAAGSSVQSHLVKSGIYRGVPARIIK